ncbi:zinc ribbon domain-containing protein [Streptomyces sp. NBC_00249]|uniref:Zn-ribbon domain-containing OB-fold protein n=1 Tax=Streptomyces sp. NBC_00249 TaxID=2975690 RepID=UPI00225B8F05|nr:zinc ribbon domain-containing protein [Streptomyces sp. NBC_00249]MCX5197999.1 zinc ribbon domain-containing protein [Streptomyces sp. NBC_00249]
MESTRTPVVSGWFTGPGAEGGFRLLGTRCSACTAVFFPREDAYCRNPHCPGGGELAEVPLSPRGRVWSCTDGRYRPPAPYVSDPDVPWEPYTLVAVELETEGMVVLGQAEPGVTVADLPVGAEVEVVPGVMDGEAGSVRTTWRFRPVGGAS